MAQIGSPSAGWYTDPSGQHLARYWDGASWTEQVRDDLGNPAETAVPPPGGVDASPTSAAPSAHPAADTVAGVAEAVAAVAANDLGYAPAAATEPPLVVDYGTGEPWVGASGNGSGTAVTDPFAAAVPTAPAPAPVPTPTEVPAIAVETAPVPEPVAPMTTGPAAGWYPDPAGRHQARLWDGTRWTERVADNGVETIDPLTAEPPAGTGAVDPTVGAWSAELPASAETAAMGSDGAALTAGQISLASLSATAAAEPSTEAPGAARPSVKVRVAGGFVLTGAIAMLFGSATTWIHVTGPKVGDESSSTGIGLGDGRITVALAVVLAVLGVGIVTGRMARFGGTKVAAMGSLVAGAAALAVTAVDIADVADRASRLGVPVGAVSNVGTGLWLAFLGALFAVGGGLMAFANRQ